MRTYLLTLLLTFFSAGNTEPFIDGEQIEKIASLGEECFGHPMGEFSAEPLTGGCLNPVYLIDIEGDKYVFRFAPEWQKQSDFFKECYFSQMMAEKGVSPEIYHISTKLRGTVMQYIPYSSGNVMTQEELKEKQEWVMDKVSEILEHVHTPQRIHPFTYFHDMLTRLEEKPCPLKLFHAIDISLEFEQLFQQFTQHTLCHNDLHLGNILFSYENDDVYLIDWTFSEYGDPYMDLAKVSRRLGHQEEILTHYLKREPTAKEEAHFHLTQSVMVLDSALYEFESYLSSVENLDEELAKKMDEDLLIAHEVDYFDFEKDEYHYWRALSLLSSFLRMEESGEFSEWVKALKSP